MNNYERRVNMYHFDLAYTETSQGVLHGNILENGIKEFRGIPYALPPVGELRWKPPVKSDSWRGIKEAVLFGGEAVQGEDIDPVHPEIPIKLSSSHRSEDCLYLNIWTPAKAVDDKLPVFVFIHGGGFFCGAGSHSLYWGQNLAQTGIVVVTINYRLGVLGFMAHPELSAESPNHVSGNYGIMDQNMALHWIKDNIAAFGGNPDQISIGGQSAGGASVTYQVISPMSKGLFKRATIQSAPAFGKVMRAKTLDEAQFDGLKFQKICGVNSISELRRMSAWDIFDKAMSNFSFWSPVIDGFFIPDYPDQIFKENKANPVDLLVGNTGEEFSTAADINGMEPQEFVTFIKSNFTDLADEVLELYPHSTKREAMRSMNSIAADIGFYYGNVLHALTSCNNHNFYLYHYEKEIIDQNADIYGASHSAELPYLFGIKNIGGPNPWNPVIWEEKDEMFSKEIMAYWTEFIKTGKPTCKGGPDWMPFELNNKKIFILDNNFRVTDYNDISRKMELAKECSKRGIKLGMFL
jgi:Carboxylesterase type B